MKIKRFKRICKFCNKEYLATDVKGNVCDECRKPKFCKCGCGRLVKGPGHLYYRGHANKGKTYKEIYGTDNPKCGFKKGEENIAKREDIKKKISKGVRESYTPELKKKRSEQIKNEKWQIYSKVSQRLFFEVLNKVENKDKIYFAKLNKEFNIWCEKENRLYSYDFVDTKRKRVIEFNGDLWHANPAVFKEDDKPNPKDKNITAKEIWEKEKSKLDFIKSLGFKTLVIWHSEYKENKEDVIDKCVNFLNNDRDNKNF